ncbi:tail fiber assembly protein [Providencia alcalifaciens]|uniref:tail fiber assembly protein n=1 Tax=Providencia alcalifaciens TaxID=126385 RepID=UPI000446A3C7|nr:tail fiber assembly protein [Providencia alcalifaciens]EUC94014.1 tail fiber assembly protein [Providencia alcalifaciens PAL-2]MTC38860.1 tail fiber assembly protein [Providencia alcalifaciens]
MPMLKIYNYTSDTHEFISESDGYIDENTQLIPYCTTIPPIEPKKGYAVIFNAESNQWEYQVDYRGHIAYQTENRQQIHIDFIGELPITLTMLEPKTEFDVWNGKKWVLNKTVQKAHWVAQAENEKISRIDEANNTINYLKDALDVGLGDDTDERQLIEWKKYRVLLNRVDTSTAPDIEWPLKP